MDSYTRKSNVLEFILNGKFYYPAFLHYSNTPIEISCSVCNKPNLISAIGYGLENDQTDSYDFCLECVDKITNSYNLNKKKNSNSNSNPNPYPYPIKYPMFSSKSNDITASNDFSNGNNTWESIWKDQFMSSVNPTMSGIPQKKFTYEGFNNNPANLNNSTGPNNLENFVQPLNSLGFKKR